MGAVSAYDHYASVKNVIFRILGTTVAYGIAGALGIALGALFFYVVFFLPSWFMKEDILLLWGWVGTPVGLIGGVAIFLTATKRGGRYLAQRFNTQVQPEA